MYPAGMQKKGLMATIKEKPEDGEARAEAKMNVKNDALLAMVYAALGVPANAAGGVTTVEDFAAWAKKEAKVAGQSVIDVIGEAPALMEVEVPNRSAMVVMDEENAEEEAVAAEKKEEEERPVGCSCRNPRP